MKVREEFEKLAIPVNRLYSDWYLVGYDGMYGNEKGRCIVSSYDIEEISCICDFNEYFSIAGKSVFVNSRHLMTEDEFFEVLATDEEVYKNFKLMYMPGRDPDFT